MKTVEIYWKDLTEAKQREILELLGDNGNYDIFSIAVIVVSFFVLNYLRGEDIFNRDIDLVGYTDDICGLTASAPVYIKGYKAGQVSSVTYDSENGRFELVCSVKKEFNLPSDSKMVIYSSDIMGSKAVRIDLGTSTSLLKDDDVLELVIEQGLVDSMSQSIMPLISTATSTLDSLSQTLSGIKGIFSDKNVLSVSDILEDVEAAMANVRQISSSVNDKSGEIADLIENLSAFSVNLNVLAEKLDTTVTGANDIVKDLNDADLEGMVSTFKSLLDKVQDPDGSLGKLINDDSVYNSVDSLLIDINILVEKIKENPKKYLKISVF